MPLEEYEQLKNRKQSEIDYYQCQVDLIIKLKAELKETKQRIKQDAEPHADQARIDWLDENTDRLEDIKCCVINGDAGDGGIRAAIDFFVRRQASVVTP